MKQKLLLILAIFCISFGSAQTFTVDGIKYTVIPLTTEVSVTGGSCYTGDLSLPSMVSYGVTNYTVTSVGDEAFRFCEGLTSISFPSTVTSIGGYSFAEASNLTSITMGVNVTTLGEYAFADTSLTAVSLGLSVTSMGDGVFSGCRFLETITNFGAVVTIGDRAFSNCNSLASFAFPSSVRTVGRSMFDGCEVLASVSIGVNMTEIGESTFSNCINLTTITIPSNITSIGDNAFSSSGLTSISIPNSVTSIGYAAFSSCAALKSVTIPNSVTSIGDFAFSRCRSLELFVSKLSTPISIFAYTFNNIDLDVCVLVVPTGKISDYSAAVYWQDFTTITDVLPVTAAPSTSYATQVYAGDDKTLANLQVTGTAVKWYDAATVGNFLENTTVLNDNNAYYASQTINEVESTERVAITVKRISDAKQTFLSNTNPTVASLVSTPSTDTTVKWFTTASGGTALENTGLLTKGTYYIEQTTPQIIETFGGSFSEPYGVAVQSDGKILVANSSVSSINRIDADGSNKVVLGSGFDNPSGIAVQSDGKILVADVFSNSIKRMDADGTNIVTLGSGFDRPFGVAVQSDGKILVADMFNNAIKRMDADGTNIETLGSGFYYPKAVTIQSDGKILVADTNNNAIKRMNADGSNIVTLGSGFNNPQGVTVQSDGKILVADTYNNAIKRMNADGSNIVTLANGFNSPQGVAVQSDGEILVADTYNLSLKRIKQETVSNRVAVEVVFVPPAPTTTYTTQVYAGDDKTLANLQVTGTAVKWYDAATVGSVLATTTVLADNATYYASQTINGVESTERLAITAKRISDAKQNVATGSTVANLVSTPTTGASVNWFTAVSGGTTLNSTALLSTGIYYVEQIVPLSIETLVTSIITPAGIAIQPDGKIVVADYLDNSIKRMDADGTNVEILGSGFNSPSSVAIQADGKIVVADYRNNAIKRMDADGSNIEVLGNGFSLPFGVAVQADGKILLTDSQNNAVKRMNADGSNIEILGNGFNGPATVAVQSDGKILVADVYNNAIKRMNADGSNIEILNSNFDRPIGIAVQSNGTILVADTGNKAVKQMDANGTNLVTLTTKDLINPFGIAMQSDGKIIVLDLSAGIKQITNAFTTNRVAVEVIEKSQPSITFVNFTKTYGDVAFDLAATSNSTGVISYEIVAGGTGSATLSGTNNKTLTLGNAGTVLLKATVAEDATNNQASATITLTISKKSITVTAASKTKVYGSTDVALTYVATPSLLGTDTFTGSLSRAVGDNGGTYAITQGTLSAGANYAIIFVPANYTITKADQVITWNQSLVLDCGSTASIVLTGNSNSGLAVNYSSSNSNVVTISNNELVFVDFGSATITASQQGNNNYNAAQSIALPIASTQTNLIRQQFDDVIFFDNSSNEFVSYTWYKNGVLVAGQTAQYFKDTAALNGTYYAVATKRNGAVVRTCPLVLISTSVVEVMNIAPNPVRSNSSYQLITNVTPAKLQNARIMVFNILGTVMTDKVINGSTIEMVAPSVEGIYIIKMILANGKILTKNLLVKN